MNTLNQYPHNIDAEHAVLGILLGNNNLARHIADILLPTHFFESLHGEIYANLLDAYYEGKSLSHITLYKKFESNQRFIEIGGKEYLIGIMQSYSTLFDFAKLKEYANAICDGYLRRQLISLAKSIYANATDCQNNISIEEQIDEAETNLYDISKTINKSNLTFQAFKNYTDEATKHAEAMFKEPEKPIGISSGFTQLDNLIGGFEPGDLIILAGRPAMGKTSLALTLTLNALKYTKQQNNNQSVMFSSLEMRGVQLAFRALSIESEIRLTSVKRGTINADEMAKLIKTSKDINSYPPFYLDESSTITIPVLISKLRFLNKKKPLGILFVDYLHLIKPITKIGLSNQVHAITEIVEGLKAIAKEFNIPVIALAQLNRGVENRDNKRPTLADLRDSGGIEQAADVVMMLHREEYYLRMREPRVGTKEHVEWKAEMLKVMDKAEIIVAKSRNGETGIAEIEFDSKLTKFRDA